jgi:hypothetical protein
MDRARAGARDVGRLTVKGLLRGVAAHIEGAWPYAPVLEALDTAASGVKQDISIGQHPPFLHLVPFP